MQRISMAEIVRRLGVTESEIAAMKPKIEALEISQKTVVDNTDEILAFVSGAKKSGTWARQMLRRHGMRVIAAGVGYALAKGWIGTELSDLFSAITGSAI